MSKNNENVETVETVEVQETKESKIKAAASKIGAGFKKHWRNGCCRRGFDLLRKEAQGQSGRRGSGCRG